MPRLGDPATRGGRGPACFAMAGAGQFVILPRDSWGGSRFEEAMNALATLIDTVISIYIYVLIAAAIMSWLIALNVINVRNRAVYYILSFLYRVTEPVLRPIRRIIPSIGGIDITPVIVIIALHFIRQLIVDNIRGV
jgi:YggT family protein